MVKKDANCVPLPKLASTIIYITVSFSALVLGNI